MKNRRLITGIIAASLIFALVIGVTGCGKKKEVNPFEIVENLIAEGHEDVMLFDFFQQVVGTEEQQGYYEIVLYAITDEEGQMSTEEVHMDVYRDGGLRSEKKTSFNVPYEVFENAMEVVKEYEMAEWNDDEDIGESAQVDGVLYVCKFPGGTEYCRVSSEKMALNGLEGFSAVQGALSVNPPPSEN